VEGFVVFKMGIGWVYVREMVIVDGVVGNGRDFLVLLW
jgi:hypothetical protein